MDRLPRKELIDLFKRLTRHVKFGRTYSEKEARKRIHTKLKFYRKVYQRAKTNATVRKYRRWYTLLERLDRHGIHRRIMREAEENPGGYVDLTIEYGADRADAIEKVILRRHRRRLGQLRTVRRRRR